MSQIHFVSIQDLARGMHSNANCQARDGPGNWPVGPLTIGTQDG